MLIIPSKDFSIVQNEIHIELKEGVEVEVPQKFIENLITEGVYIKSDSEKETDITE